VSPLGGVTVAFDEQGAATIQLGTTVPSDAAGGYAKGCLFIHTDGSGANDVLYYNVGSSSSANFDALSTSGGLDMTNLAASAAEINSTCDRTGRVIAASAGATALALTQATHADRIVVVPVITSAGLTITLPAATGTGDKYTVFNNGVQTVSLTITALAGDLLYGKAIGFSQTVAASGDVFVPDGSDDVKWTYNVTTTGGDGGDIATFIDIATDAWLVDIVYHGSGTMDQGFA